MKIIGIGGSLRSHSYTYQTLKAALQYISNQNIEIELIDLRQLKLPFCDGSITYPDFPDVEFLRQKVQEANGILLATPEYHGSVSGVLKNALDLIEEEHIKGKVVALIAVLGGVHSTNAINTLRIVCRQLHCWVLPEQIVIPQAEGSFNEEGELMDSSLKERLYAMMDHLIYAAYRLAKNSRNSIN